MKKIILIASGLLIISGVNAQDLKESEVPEIIKQSFLKIYPNTKVDGWEKEGTNYEVEFHLNNAESSAIFDANGRFKELEQEIKITELPIAATEYCAKTYVGYKLEEAAKITDVSGKILFEAELKKGKEHFDVMFDDKGNVIKKGDVETKKEAKD
jgi:hypothetical protein